MGAEQVNGCLPKRARVVLERLTKKTEPEGAGLDLSSPLLSVQKLGNQNIGSPSARTRWLTERIASPATRPKPSGIKQRKRRFEFSSRKV
jgi:hypothetical protein